MGDRGTKLVNGLIYVSLGVLNMKKFERILCHHILPQPDMKSTYMHEGIIPIGAVQLYVVTTLWLRSG